MATFEEMLDFCINRLSDDNFRRRNKHRTVYLGGADAKSIAESLKK